MSEASACLDEQTLAEFVSGELAASDLRNVEAHLAGCADCRAAVADAAHGVNEAALSETALSSTALEAQTFPRSGEILAGKYRVDAPLGRGGMGVVFAAQHIELGHAVAIKVLNSKDRHAAARFLREAKTSARLLGDHIARVFDLGRLPNGVPYFVMERLLGQDLASRMAQGPVPVALAVEYVLQACRALKDAHALGVVHRDLKPSNLFLVERPDGKPWIKVLDFGISKVVDSRTHTANLALTATDAVLGSPLYMSPEQIRSSREVDARTDIWSLGVIAYEILTRRRPFEAPTLSSVLLAIALEEPAPPSSLVPDLPRGLEAVVLRCLAKDPAARFPDVGALIDALIPFASPVTSPNRPSPALRWTAAGGAVLVLGVLAALLPRSCEQGRPDGPAAPTVPQQLTAGPQRLSVHCDHPLPAAQVQWLSGSMRVGTPWPLARMCEAESLTSRRDELWQQLEASAITGAALEPSHPFYTLALQRAPEPSLRLARAARAHIAIQLSGAACAAIESIALHEAAGGRLLAQAVRSEGSGSCAWASELAFEDFGKAIAVQLTPAKYSARDTAFDAERLAFAVQEVLPQDGKTPPVTPKKHGGTAKPPSKPPQSGNCLPPLEFCRK